jgi:hypothetical protein
MCTQLSKGAKMLLSKGKRILKKTSKSALLPALKVLNGKFLQHDMIEHLFI